MANENRETEELETLMFICALPDCPPDCLRLMRKRMGWTQLTLATAIGVTEGTIGNWESLKKQLSPSKEDLVRICIVMKLKNELALAFIKKANGTMKLAYSNFDFDLYKIMKLHCDETLEIVNQKIEEAKNRYPKN